MALGVVGWLGPRMRQVAGTGYSPMLNIFGVYVECSIVTNGIVVRKYVNRSSCHLAWQVGLAQSLVCLMGVQIPQVEGEVLGFFDVNLLVCDFPLRYRPDKHIQFE